MTFSRSSFILDELTKMAGENPQDFEIIAWSSKRSCSNLKIVDGIRRTMIADLVTQLSITVFGI